MVHNIFVLDQVPELQVLMAKLRNLKDMIPESLQVGIIIGKLLSILHDYMKKLLIN